MSDQSGPAARDSRDLPDRPSLRHLKLEAKRRLSAGEFTTLHDAQLAIAREHGMSSWAALKERVVAAAAEHGHALAQVRWVLGRYAEAGAPGWSAPSRGELSEHFTEQFLGFVSPEALGQAMVGLTAMLREDLILIDADAFRLSAKLAGTRLRVEAGVQPEAPHRIDMLRFFPDGEPVTDARITQPPSAGSGPVPGQVPGAVEDAYAKFSLVGLTAAGNAGGGPASEGWTCSRGWADLERDVPLGSGHRFPALQITALVTATAVLRLVAEGVVALDDPVSRHLRALRLADDAVTVRELLAHTGGVDSCSGPRGEFAYSNGGYAVVGQLIADLTGTSFTRAATRLVLEPLGMADSWFPAEPPASPDAAYGYELDEDGSLEREEPQVFTLQSAGGLWSTGPDLVRFGSGWRTLLPAELAAEALRPQGPRRDAVEETGLGWGLRRSMDAAGQAGIGPGWAASLIMRPGGVASHPAGSLLAGPGGSRGRSG